MKLLPQPCILFPQLRYSELELVRVYNTWRGRGSGCHFKSCLVESCLIEFGVVKDMPLESFKTHLVA